MMYIALPECRAALDRQERANLHGRREETATQEPGRARILPAILTGMAIIREEFHRVVDQLPEGEPVQLLDHVKVHAHHAETPVWDRPDFLGAFASGRGDVSERTDEMLFTGHPTTDPTNQ